MSKEFVPYELAVKLKELGFDEPCLGYYSNVEFVFGNHTNNVMQRFRYSAPTIAEVVMWLYEKHDIYINVIPDLSSRHNLIDRKFYVSMFKYSMNINLQVEILKEDKNILYFNKLENAYEFGILHALKNLI